MAVRYRKYFSQCKPIPCNGRQGKYCPGDRPKRSSGEYKTCGTWCIEFFDDRKEWQSLTFKDVTCKTEAEKRLVLFISDRERGKLNLPKRKIIPTLAEYAEKYLELYRNTKENTFRLKRSVTNSLVKYLGSYSLDKITPFIIEKYRVERKEKDLVKDCSLNVDIAVLSHIFNTAIKSGLIDKNPCTDIKRLKVAHTRDKVLTESEIALILNGHSLEKKDRLMILVSLFTGMRLNEVLSLRWDNIDFSKSLISFVQSKTGKSIIVPISSYFVNELQAYKGGRDDEYLFEEREINHDVVLEYSKYFGKLFKQLGISNFTFHNLRHTFASLQGDLGTGAITTKELLGHSDLSMTLRYSHTGLDSKRKAVESLTGHILSMTDMSAVVSQAGTA